jgi:uncharacterized protein YdbL (DUF1318 family)
MKRFARHLFGTLCAVMLVFGAAGHADAQSKLDQYRAAGYIAERFDGLTELRAGAPADAAGLVHDVNARRQAIYGARAQNQGVPHSAVGKIYAAEVMEKAPAGTWFRREDGSYTRK